MRAGLTGPRYARRRTWRTVDSADYAPPENARAVFAELSARLDEQAARFRAVVAERGGALDEAIRAAGLPPFGPVE